MSKHRCGFSWAVSALLAPSLASLAACGADQRDSTSLTMVAGHQPDLPADDVTVSFARATTPVMEDAGQTEVAVVLRTTYPALRLAAQVTVFDTGTGTARSGSDYSPFSPQLVTFPPGSVDGETQVVTFDPRDDLLVEGTTDTVKLRLEDPSGCRVTGHMIHTIQITDVNRAEIGFATNSSVTLNESTASYPVALELGLGPGVRLGVPVSALVV